MARPTSLTAERHRTIIETLRRGAFPRTAARCAQIDRSTYFRWLARGREDLAAGRRATPYARLVVDVERVEGEVEVELLGVLQRRMDAGDTRAMIWFLEHRFPATWGRRATVKAEQGMDAEEFRTAVAAILGELAVRTGPSPG